MAWVPLDYHGFLCRRKMEWKFPNEKLWIQKSFIGNLPNRTPVGSTNVSSSVNTLEFQDHGQIRVWKRWWIGRCFGTLARVLELSKKISHVLIRKVQTSSCRTSEELFVASKYPTKRLGQISKWFADALSIGILKEKMIGRFYLLEFSIFYVRTAYFTFLNTFVGTNT